MKVYIGDYPDWIGPYQLADMVPFISQDKRNKLGNWLSETWVNDVCQWIYDKTGKRKVNIRIDKYDTWNMDHTLALIILPMLKKLKESKAGSPFIDDEDLPEHMRYSFTTSEDDWDKHDRWVDYKWEWILNEIIWTFEHIVDDDWQYVVTHEKFLEINDRVSNGLRLFGKYYRSLWS